MDHKSAVDLLIRILNDVQEGVSDEKERITGRTCPLQDLFNFDSLASVMTTGQILEEIGEDEDSKIQNLFVAEDSNGRLYALTINEIAKTIVELSNGNMEE